MSGPRKKGFLGYLINIQSYEAIFKLYAEEKQYLKYVLGHKLSQDHLEMMFGTIRSSLGLNNNPTVIQERAWKVFTEVYKFCWLLLLYSYKNTLA